MASPSMPLPPGAKLIDQGAMQLPPGAKLVSGAQQKPQDAGFFTTLGKDLMNAPTQVMDLVSGHPIDKLTEMGTALTEGRKQAFQQAKDAYGKGNYKEAFEHLVGSIPIFGPPLNAAMNESRMPQNGTNPDETHQGLPGQGLAHGVEALAPYSGGLITEVAGRMPAAVGAAGRVATAAKAGVKAAGPDIVMGGAKVAAGEGLSQIPGMAWPARIALDYPGARQIASGLGKGGKAFKEALSQKIAAATESLSQTPGQALAKSQGQDWAKLSTEDRSMLEQVAKAQANTQAQPAPVARPVQQPQPAPVSAPGKTVQELIQEELAANRAAEPEAPHPLTGGNSVQPIAPRGTPIRPPVQAPPAAQPTAINPPEPLPVSANGAQPIVAPPPLSMAQAESAMARKTPAVADSPQQVVNGGNGDKFSPQYRGAQRTQANIEAKAQRFAEAFHAEGITAEDVGNMTKPDAEAMTNGLIAKGLLQKGEMPPNSSIPMIRKYLKALESDRPQVTPTPISGPLSKNPKALEIARKLAEAIQQ